MRKISSPLVLTKMWYFHEDRLLELTQLLSKLYFPTPKEIPGAVFNFGLPLHQRVTSKDEFEL